MLRGSWKWTPACLVFMVVPLTCMLCFGVFLLGPVVWHDVWRESFDNFLIEVLGLECSADYTLSAEDRERVIEAGLDPDIIANAAGAIPWIGTTLGRTCDIGMLYAIPEAETVGFTTYGGSSFTPASDSNAGWLLDRFEDYDIRASNPLAAQYIGEGYRSYRGHGAGEMGVGFWPPTGKRVCERYLADDGDSEIASCDYWLPKTYMRAIGATISASPYGYDASMSDEEKVAALYGWNQILGYRQDLVNRANEINELVGDVVATGRVRSRGEPHWPFFDFIRTDWVIPILDDIGILPDVQGWLDAPFPEDFPREVTQGWRDTEHTDSAGHPGIDWNCETGDPILAVAAGEVITPGFDTLMGYLSDYSRSIDNGFGNTVWLEHSNGFYTLYAHLDSVDVATGDDVAIGQQIGTCGNTGHSFGTHIHLGVSDVHPDEIASYHQWGPGGWIDPNLVLGTCVVA